jgi:hypothetical protein
VWVLERREGERLVVLGDVHGRWDLVAGVLRANGLLGERGAWAGGRATLVQMGDLLDADLTQQYALADDPLGDQLVSDYRQFIEDARAIIDLKSAAREALDACITPVEGVSGAALWAHRQRWVSAALVWRTVQGWMRLEAEAEAAGGRVLTLMGNHEVDLLSGRGWWYREQKRAWLALEGVEGAFFSDDVGADGGQGVAQSARDALAHPTLQWLRDRPVVLILGNLLMMHGGPTRALTRAWERRWKATQGIQGMMPARDALVTWLEEFLNGKGWDDDAFGEGKSALSPERSKDDVVGDLSLLRPWLVGAECDWLLLGHSPFLGLDTGLWVDARDPALRQHLEGILRLGEAKAVIKLDTNLKRGGRAQALVIEGDQVVSPQGLLGDGERVSRPRITYQMLWTAQQLVEGVDATRGPALMDLEELGLDAESFGALMEGRDLVEATLTQDALEALGKAIGALLRASPSTLTPMLEAWQEQLGRGDAEAALAEAIGRARDVQGAIQGLVKEVEAALGGEDAPQGACARVWLDPRRCVLGGIRYQLLERVLEALWARQQERGQAPSPAIGVLLTTHRGRPAARLRHFSGGDVRPVDESLHPWSPQGGAESGTWRALEVFAQGLLAAATLHPDASARAQDAEDEEMNEDESVTEVTEVTEVTQAHRSAHDTKKAEQKDNKNPRTYRDVIPSQAAIIPAEALRALRAVNAAALGAYVFDLQYKNQQHEEIKGEGKDRLNPPHQPPTWRAGWLDLPSPKRTRAVALPNGRLVLADTTFTQPSISLSLQSIDLTRPPNAPPHDPQSATDHPWHPQPLTDTLLQHWDPPADTPITLYAHLKRDVVRALQAGELDWLRSLSPRADAPAWRSGCYLFTTPTQAAAQHFSPLNPIPVTFSLPLPSLRAWLQQRWLTLNLMISDAATPLDPSARWGAPEVVLEVVALGEDGVRALWSHRAT